MHSIINSTSYLIFGFVLLFCQVFGGLPYGGTDSIKDALLRSELISVYGQHIKLLTDGWMSGDNSDLESIGPSIYTSDFSFLNRIGGTWREGRSVFIDEYIFGAVDACIEAQGGGNGCDFAVAVISDGVEYSLYVLLLYVLYVYIF